MVQFNPILRRDSSFGQRTANRAPKQLPVVEMAYPKPKILCEIRYDAGDRPRNRTDEDKLSR